MRIFVTGATGFIGQHFVDHALTAGHSVAALRRTDSPNRAKLVSELKSRGVEFHSGNVRDPASLRAAMRGADCVCHFASAFREGGASDDYFRSVNVAGTQNAVDAAAGQGVRRFVMCSTAGIYGKVVPGITDESTPVNPANIYERTKVRAEEVVRQSAVAHGIEYSIVRPAVVYGPRDERLYKLFSTASIGVSRWVAITRPCTFAPSSSVST